MIDLQTKMIGLFGQPLGFSFAAQMQNATYEAMGLNMLYFYAEMGNDTLPDALAAVRCMNFAGCAITKPNKVFVMRYLDEADDLCAKMGSCNTIVKLPNGRLKGYNTDGIGAWQTFVDTGLDVPASTFFCLGAGGAGRSVASTLAFHGAKKIYVCDPVPEAAQSLADDINTKIAPVAQYVPDADRALRDRCITESDVVMNITGMGMIGHENETPVDAALLRPGQLCFDATYNPAVTRFLREAEARGCKTLNGVGMNILQGAYQIELWSGRKPPVDEMTRIFNAIQAQSGK